MKMNHLSSVRGHARDDAGVGQLDAAEDARLNEHVTRALYSMLVAVIVMITVPVSQLRTIAVRTECCCPDPSRCHCPDHETGPAGQTSIKACHKSSDIVVGSSASEVVAAPPVVVDAPALRVAAAEHILSSPHAPPSPARPPAPS
jgi:hypothetical protein